MQTLYDSEKERPSCPLFVLDIVGGWNRDFDSEVAGLRCPFWIKPREQTDRGHSIDRVQSNQPNQLIS
jgi:hypothetical protein